MEHYEQIIESRRIPMDASKYFYLLIYITMTGMLLYAFWQMNYTSKPDPFKTPVDFINVVFVLGVIFCLYNVFLSFHKLKLRFYETSKLEEKKIIAIEKVAAINKWKLRSQETNYYIFYENNWIFQSYNITITCNKNGFYINSYPDRGRVLDFGKSLRKTDDIFEELKHHL